MKTTLLMVCLISAGEISSRAQLLDFDSRSNPPPYSFNWSDAYNYVDIWGTSHVEVNGGFLNFFTLREAATGTVEAGQISALSACDDASLLVLGANCDLITAEDHSKIDLYGGEQSGFGQVFALDDGVIRIFGGNFDWVHSGADNDGRVEVSGYASINTLSSWSKGIVFQRGAYVQQLEATGNGVTVLNDGEVYDRMTAEGDSTLILAGGYPASDIRLFENAHLLVLHTDDVRPDYELLQVADCKDPGANANCLGKDLTVALDDGYQNFQISVWTNTAYLGGYVWHGKVELVKVGTGLKAFKLDGEMMALAFRIPSDQIARLECSTNLTVWQPWKSAIPGDGNVHVETLRIHKKGQFMLRLKSWPKPSL